MTRTGELKSILMDGLWRQNTGLVVLLGLCPLLAVTGTVINGLGLGLATMLILMASNLSVSLLRGLLRPEIRIPAFVLIIASVVIRSAAWRGGWPAAWTGAASPCSPGFSKSTATGCWPPTAAGGSA